MSPARPSSSGYSLIELLVVLAIVGILAIAGVTMIGNRQAGAVRGLLDELEGALSNAHKSSAATGRDVAMVTWGTWAADTPLSLAHGEASLTDAQIQDTANGLLAGTAPAATLGNAGHSVAMPFRFLAANDAIHMRARVVAIGSTHWTTVTSAPSGGAANESLSSVAPFASSGTGSGGTSGIMTGVVDDANNLFSLSATTLKRFVINGTNKRFTSTFIIPVVGTNSSGGAVPGGPMGLIVVLANGGTIYKFYNPGSRDSDGKWRRI